MDFGSFLRGAVGVAQGMASKAADQGADIIWRKFNGDVDALREVARGDHPTATPSGVKAAQLALQKHGYRW